MSQQFDNVYNGFTMLTDKDFAKAEELFSDKEWKAEGRVVALVTPTQAKHYQLMRERQNKFLTYLGLLGVTKKEAAQASGFDESTIYNWERDTFSSFSSRVNLASDYSRRDMIEQIKRHARKDWRAAAWWLERKHAKEFGEVKKAQVDVNIVGQLNVNERKNISDRFLGLLQDADAFTIQEPSQATARRAD